MDVRVICLMLLSSSSQAFAHLKNKKNRKMDMCTYRSTFGIQKDFLELFPKIKIQKNSKKKKQNKKKTQHYQR